jgi:hypothetical protein
LFELANAEGAQAQGEEEYWRLYRDAVGDILHRHPDMGAAPIAFAAGLALGRYQARWQCGCIPKTKPDKSVDHLGVVSVSGTLSGKGIGYPNNSVRITCAKEEMYCYSSTIEQIGYNQVSTLAPVSIYRITKWDASEIIANSPDDPTACARVTINLARKSQVVLWEQEPINQSMLFCRRSSTSIYKWTIEDPPYWRAAKTPGGDTK